MIEKCFADDINPVVININTFKSSLSYSPKERERITKKISSETGVPEKYITSEFHSYISHWYKINKEWYFYKTETRLFLYLNELLGEIVSNYFGLDTVHYDIALLNVKHGISEYGHVSKSFCDRNYSYETAVDLEIDSTDDLSVLDNIRVLCKTDEEYKLLLSDLKKFFIRDFYTSQEDRRACNFMFKINENGIRLGPLYDYEFSFDLPIIPKYKNHIGVLDIKDISTICRLRYDDEFQKLLQLIIDANMGTFLEMVEDKHHIIIPLDHKFHYKEHDAKIKKLVIESKALK